MNYLNLFFSLLICFIDPFITHAQQITGNDTQENLFKLGGTDAASGVVRKFDNRYEGVKGTPFYIDAWSKGAIILENDQRIDNVQLKYNVYEDELIINTSNSGQYYYPKENIKLFILADDTSSERITFAKLPHPKKEANSSTTGYYSRVQSV